MLNQVVLVGKLVEPYVGGDKLFLSQDEEEFIIDVSKLTNVTTHLENLSSGTILGIKGKIVNGGLGLRVQAEKISFLG